MPWTFAGLLRLFGSDGAFILVERLSHGQPMFNIIPSTCLQGMETLEDKPHLQSVLLVSNNLYGTPAMADSIVHFIVHDSAVRTIYTESVELAETVIRDAGEVWNLPLKRQTITYAISN
ncbi:hypothetical protein BD769DRAFT_1669804 [Suillus cothurnatus]|nr:hypothetical protein BD769DRAFT_1669804 [Suillus cothurnatus]